MAAALSCYGFSVISQAARAGQTDVQWLSICQGCPSNPFGITETGVISGNVATGQGERGFLLNPHGDVTYVDVPGHILIELLKGNNRGEFAGVYFSLADFRVHGFVRARNGALRDVTYPEAAVTVLGSINGAGITLGSYTNDPSTATGYVSFIERNGRFPLTFKYPDPKADNTIALGFSAWGSVVGVFTLGSPALHAFVRDHDGEFSEIMFPAASETYLSDINESGAAVGFWRDQSGAYRGLAYRNGLCYMVDLPLSPSGYTNSTLTGINNQGNAVGVAFAQNPGDGDGFLLTGLQHGNGTITAGAGIPCKAPYRLP